MPNATESKPRRTIKPPETKLCLKCGRVKPISEYYANRDWEDQLGKDIWCKECVNRCSNKDEVREYFWENHREWDDRVWQKAGERAEKLASNNTVYQKANDDRRKTILERLTCQQVPAVMALYYHYVENGKDGKTTSYAEAKANGKIKEEIDPDIKTYSEEFNGYFKPSELAFLENYYKGLETDFDLSDTNLRDIARKVAKASLQADKAQDDFMAGRCDYSVVKDAMSQFDLLSKSGNFAACKRKPGDNAGMNSWSELTLKLETTGHPCTRKIEWPKDDVDKTIEEFKYIIEALGLDQQ